MKMPELQRFDQSHLGMPWVEAGEFLLSDLDLITLAAMKLTNGATFSSTEVQHVFAVLSQRSVLIQCSQALTLLSLRIVVLRIT